MPPLGVAAGEHVGDSGGYDDVTARVAAAPAGVAGLLSGTSPVPGIDSGSDSESGRFMPVSPSVAFNGGVLIAVFRYANVAAG
jgi:hypothetical protein